MSTASLPSYPSPPELFRTPSYQAEPRAEERRIAHALFYQRRGRTVDFIKQSKSGGVSLRLTDQAEGTETPTYGSGTPVEVCYFVRSIGLLDLIFRAISRVLLNSRRLMVSRLWRSRWVHLQPASL
jgi:hypothetical protein